MVLKDDDVYIAQYVKGENTTVIHLKDLGPQVDWQTVFLLEYLGPFMIHQLIFVFYSVYEYRSKKNMMVWAMLTLHYGKRILESLFVHRFSHASMPLAGALKNCTYYWGLGGVYLGLTCILKVEAGWDIFDIIALISFLTFESLNLAAHVKLRNLRPKGTRIRACPHGFPLFDLVACPNYFFELLAWIAFALFVRTQYMAYGFAVLGGAQMAIWAVKKHAAYKYEFPTEYKAKYAMIPYVI